MPPVEESELRKLKKWYAEELRAKDRMIDELRKENQALIQTALRQAHRTRKWQKVAHDRASEPKE
jgi:hypothetical protein